MGAPAPQWLFTAFAEAMTQIGATAPASLIQAEARDLISRWNESGRFLHTSQHLINVLASIDELAGMTHDPDILRVTFWYHGAFLNRALEARTLGADPAQLCGPCISHTTNRLVILGVSADVISRIGELLLALVTHQADRSDTDAQVLIDADRSILAESPQVYRSYREELRKEFDDLDDLTYWLARRRVVTKLLARDSIYLSPLGQAWEDAARSNVEAELAKLNSLIAAVQPDALSDDEDVDVSPDLPAVEADVSATGTLIIRRRHLHKNVCTQDLEPASTGILPAITSDDATARALAEEAEEDTQSSLETAIDDMD